jgi:hypothetical protein
LTNDNFPAQSSPAGRLEVTAVALLGLVLLFCSQLPFLWASRADRLGEYPGSVFTGAPPTYADEAATYWSWMRQARDGQFFMSDLYTTEEHPRNYLNILWGSLGAVCRLTGWSVVAVYSGARVLFGAALIALLYRLSGRLFILPGQRLACIAALLMAGGWEGLFRFLGPLPGVPRLGSPAWWTPGISTFFPLMIFPHILAARIAMVGFILLMMRAWSPGASPPTRRIGASTAAGLVLSVLTFFHPYEVAPLIATIWISPVLFGISEGRWSRSEWQPPLVASLVWLPSFVYNVIIFRTNPVMRAWDLQNLMPTPHWKRLVIALGVSLILSVVALLALPRWGRPLLLMLAWLLSMLVCIQLPLRFQYRTIGGINIPLASLATAALALVAAPRLASLRLDRHGWRCLILAALIAPVWFATPFYLLRDEWAHIREVTYPSWLKAEEVEGLSYLEESTPPRSVILASYEMGNWIPPYTGRRCVLGHYALSVDATLKGEQIKRFFSAGPEDDPWRREILRRWSVGYLLYGSFERRLGGFDPASRGWLEEVFAAGADPERRLTIYSVASSQE